MRPRPVWLGDMLPDPAAHDCGGVAAGGREGGDAGKCPVNPSGFAAALADHLPERSAPPPKRKIEPLTFAVHRVNGSLSPALYHGYKMGRRDPVVFEQRIDTLPNGAELCAMPAGELLDELWSRYLALETLGALPERVGPPTKRSAG
jgi:hypothetical protein